MLKQKASTQSINYLNSNKNQAQIIEMQEEDNTQPQPHLVMGDAGSEKLHFFDIITNGTVRELSQISDEPESLAYDLTTP